MQSKIPIVTMLSHPRFKRYMDATQNDIEQAFKLYRKNQIISESLYVPLQNLEVSLRNAIHHTLMVHWGTDWYDQPINPLLKWQINKVAKAKWDISRRGQRLDPGRVIAELTFGFWAGMFDGYFEHRLWHRGLLEFVFPHAPRSFLSASRLRPKLESIRELRNRIFHHEPVFRVWHARQVHLEMNLLLNWINPAFHEWNHKHDAFSHLLASGKLK